jgi:hypothetical protein
MLVELTASMSEAGQKRRFDHRQITSGMPLSTDILGVRRLVSKVPIPDGAPNGAVGLLRFALWDILHSCGP